MGRPACMDRATQPMAVYNDLSRRTQMRASIEAPPDLQVTHFLAPLPDAPSVAGTCAFHALDAMSFSVSIRPACAACSEGIVISFFPTAFFVSKAVRFRTMT